MVKRIRDEQVGDRTPDEHQIRQQALEALGSQLDQGVVGVRPPQRAP